MDWWNQTRQHGAIGDIPPAKYEAIDHHQRDRRQQEECTLEPGFGNQNVRRVRVEDLLCRSGADLDARGNDAALRGVHRTRDTAGDNRSGSGKAIVAHCVRGAAFVHAVFAGGGPATCLEPRRRCVAQGPIGRPRHLQMVPVGRGQDDGLSRP